MSILSSFMLTKMFIKHSLKREMIDAKRNNGIKAIPMQILTSENLLKQKFPSQSLCNKHLSRLV